MFSALLNFDGPFGTNCLSLNNEPCMTRPIFYLNPLEHNYFSLIVWINVMGAKMLMLVIYLQNCNWSETKDISVKVFDMITGIT